MAVRNPFKIDMLRRQFDACLHCHEIKHRDLVRPDGTPHRGNTIATWFWRGYEGVKPNWDAGSRQSAAYAAFRAGQVVKKQEGKTNVQS